ncbi:MAG: nucleotidyltransferase domain-containing protein [Oscillochloridaceae bacterium]|nr:nucleotidyltransferase domain-containing protein [Chloroflexaceae bacterium]MDW8392039.1 nucleotidyltransferase domain-containing protein [Oscillochloridaceae bacterium]
MTTGKEHEDPSYWRRRETAALARDRRLARQARADAEAIAAMLRQRFGASRVVLFGSLARNRFTADSDIDLAVAGLAPEDYYRAIAEASKLSAFPVDLKPLEALTPHFRERMLQTGEDM